MHIKRSIVTGAAAVLILLALIGFFIMYLYSMEAMNMENALYIEKDKLKDDMIYLESLLENDHSIVHLEKGDYIYEHEKAFSPEYHRDLIEHMTHDMGIEVAIYIKENDNYHCITSSIVDSNGNPAVDIYLGEESAAYVSIQSGLDYTGKDVILGNNYITLYRPLFQPGTDEVMGILFTGIKMEAVKNIISHKSNVLAMNFILIKICGIVLGTLLIVILITILIRIIVEKNMAEERLKVIFDAMPLGASIHNQNFEYFDCNKGMLNIFDLSSKQEYFDCFDRLSPEYQPDGRLSKDKMDELINEALAKGYYNFEWMHQKMNGEPVPCEITLVRVKNNNEFTLAVYVRDLRELKTVITKKNESEKLLHTLNNILNSIDEQIYVTIPHTGEILFVNNFMKNDFKIGDDCIGKLCYKVFLKDMDGICDFCPCYQLDKEPNGTVVWEMRNPVTTRIYRNTTRYIEWSDGRAAQIQYSVDMTELITAKEQAEQSSRYKSQFLSRMSHEIRTPMNAILGITEIQLQDETMPPRMREAMDRIFHSGYILLGIINDILDLSKVEAGKLELSPVSYDILNLINDTIQLTVMRYKYKPIDFNLKVDENIPLTLFGDELRIKQILNNLLSNAFKYTDKGEISMSVAAENTQKEENSQIILVIRVADTGQGMTSEQVDMVFDEYTRFNMEANRTTEGVGLGMNITKNLVHMMNGEITVESELGKGSVFTVRLPQGIVGSGVLSKESVEKINQFNVGRAAQTNNALQFVREYMPYGRVLIVDDIETNLYVARGLMASYGLSIETAKSGPEAIEKIKGGATYDIIFMDHFMPKMDGMEAARIIRDLGYTYPIIALTANALAGQAEIFLENGFDGFISKPIDISQLNDSLNKLIRDKYPSGVVETARKQALKINMAKSSAEKVQSSSELELAAVFSRDAEKAVASLKTIISNAFRRGDDFRQYVISVHAMKSALANIGENELSATALKLELAGRAENISVIMAETTAFLEALSEVIEKNRPKGEDNIIVDNSNNTEYLAEKLHIIRTACEKYDETAAHTVLSELKQKKWPLYTKALLDTIAEYLLHSDFEEIVKLAEDYEKTINVTLKGR
ncbi:MAG: response regulator [Treponema sp.]|jgi:signal transduction histidine kinase/CheY-like chemotaxis protein/PAS domain-containing protein/HPt (histidine-containing phosphotransfer) domain-containing protein|nr:response regulator [Treponema sp.]